MMRTIKILIAIFLLLSFSCKNDTVQKTAITSTQNNMQQNRLEILDFHNTHRCKACLSIEAKTKETMKRYFPEEINSGKLVFRLINADKKENEEIVEKYSAYGTSLILNLIKDGQEKHIDITNFAFKKENRKSEFIKELKEKIEEQLKKI